MTEFMGHLDQPQRQAIQGQASPGHQIHPFSTQAFGLLQHAPKPQHKGDQGPAQEGRAPQAADPRQQPAQCPVGMNQRNAKEQVVVQQPGESSAQPLSRLGERWRGACRVDQFLALSQLQHGKHVFGVDVQRGLKADLIGDGLRVAQPPAAQHLEGGPVDAQEAVAHGVLQCPGRLPLGIGGAGVQAQLFPQLGPGQSQGRSSG